MNNNGAIISDAITAIIDDFIHTHDGDKQCFDPTETPAYQELISEGLTDEFEVTELISIIEHITDGYEELCYRFGDRFPE